MSATNTKRIVITLPEEMATLLQETAVRENSNAAAILRYAFSEYMAKTYGATVDYRLAWGGNRYTQASAE